MKVFKPINGSSRETNKSQINTMMKQRWGLDRNHVLWSTPGDPWFVEQHHWNTGAKENQQLSPGGPSNRQVEVLYYPGGEKQRRWSDCAHAQADLRLCCSHIAKTVFLISWLLCRLSNSFKWRAAVDCWSNVENHVNKIRVYRYFFPLKFTINYQCDKTIVLSTTKNSCFLV